MSQCHSLVTFSVIVFENSYFVFQIEKIIQSCSSHKTFNAYNFN